MWIIQTLAGLAILSAATGIFFAFIFLSIKGNKALANKMLSLLLITFSIRIAEIAFFWTKYIWDFPHLLDVSTSMPLLFGVFIYFYVKYSQSEEEKLNYRFFIHLIPFIIYLIYLAPTYLQSANLKLAELRNITSKTPVYGIDFYTFRILKLIHMVIYAVLAMSLVNNFSGKNLNEQKKNELRWQRYLVIGFIVFIIITGLQTFGIAISGYKYIIELDSALMITCAFMIYGSIYFTVKNPDIFISSLRRLPLLKYKKSLLNEEKASEYLNAIIKYMQEEKPYLNPELKLSDLSKQISIQTHHISQIINKKFGCSFSDFINRYRVNDAKELLINPEYDKFTILSICYEVGFKNKASFNSAFKKFTKLTPSEYKNNSFKFKTNQ